MSKALEKIAAMEYPGRVIVIGASTTGNPMALYAITGRSPSSQARRFSVDENKKVLDVVPTDEETLKTGQVDLLVYAAFIYSKGLVVGNGKQTVDIAAAMDVSIPAVEVLARGQRTWDFEPDEPNFTPRISACIARNAAFSVIKRASDGSSVRYYYEVPLVAGKGRLVSTYTGENAKPLPSFRGEPIELELPFANAQEAVDALYAALGPSAGKPDYRVSAAAATVEAGGKVTIKVINRAG